MTKIDTPTCLSENEIALLLDLALTENEKVRVLAHLRHCTYCRSVCMDDARFVAAWRSGEFEFLPAPEMGEAHERPAVPKSGGSRTTSRRRSNRGLIPALAGAAFVVALAAIWLVGSNGSDRSALPESVTRPVLLAVETASRNGLVVIPGGENNLDPEPSLYRSGDDAGDESLRASLEHLHRIYDDGDANQDALYWLIAGYLSVGRNALARVIASEAVEEYPENVRLRLLFGLAKYADGDAEGAEIELRKVALITPNDPTVLVNLGLVLSARNENEEASGILNRVIKLQPNTPLSGRAQAILDTVQSGQS